MSGPAYLDRAPEHGGSGHTVISLDRQKTEKLYVPTGTSVLGGSAGTGGGYPVIRTEKGKTGDFIETGFREAELAQAYPAIGLHNENCRNVMQSVGGRNGIRMLVDQDLKSKPVLLRKILRFLHVIFGNCPES